MSLIQFSIESSGEKAIIRDFENRWKQSQTLRAVVQALVGGNEERKLTVTRFYKKPEKCRKVLDTRPDRKKWSFQTRHLILNFTN